ncbi:MAG: amidohydrolase [Anaerolineae bacterium]|nr:amidohydrolase [Anaerolineae bacterium]
MAGFLQEAQDLMPQLVNWRRDFHRHPELGFEEVRTAGIVARHLHDLGLEVTQGIGRTGVVAILEGSRPGPTVMLRFDMDALPIVEANQTDYISHNPGVMHACGHDGHTAIGLGVSTLLTRHRAELAGRVKFVFQPAEEGLGGALAMINDGALESPRPDVAFGLHLWNTLPVGRAIVQAGRLMAASDKFILRVRGRGGHGALPHETIDTVVVGAHLVIALQTIVSRNVDPAQTAVLTIGKFQAGQAYNIIAETAEMVGGFRSFKADVRQTMIERIEAVTRGVASTFGATGEVEWLSIAPPVVNDDKATAHIATVAEDILGAENVTGGGPLMVSEDMAEFLQRVPGCFFFIGSMNEERGLKYPHHNPHFDFDEKALPLGLAIMCEATAQKLR